jgi:hypothetical protein
MGLQRRQRYRVDILIVAFTMRRVGCVAFFDAWVRAKAGAVRTASGNRKFHRRVHNQALTQTAGRAAHMVRNTYKFQLF